MLYLVNIFKGGSIMDTWVIVVFVSIILGTLIGVGVWYYEKKKKTGGGVEATLTPVPEPSDAILGDIDCGSNVSMGSNTCAYGGHLGSLFAGTPTVSYGKTRVDCGDAFVVSSTLDKVSKQQYANMCRHSTTPLSCSNVHAEHATCPSGSALSKMSTDGSDITCCRQ
jgi:hypothetical protein